MPRSVDVVLVNPGGRAQTYQSLGSELAAVEPPVWAGMMATFLRNNGLAVSIIDAYAEQLDPEQTAERIAKMNPVLAAIIVYGHQPSASTQVMPSSGAICTALKERAPDIDSMMVGGHASALPERTLQDEDTRFVCQGEGPCTLLGLTEVLKSGGKLEDVPGLWYRQGEEIRFTRLAPLIEDLDRELPGLAWDLLPMDRYRAHNWHCFGRIGSRSPYGAIYTTLGCPFTCTFCCINAPFEDGVSDRHAYRYWSPQKALEQIDILVQKYGVQNLKIADEMFVLNPKHVTRICDLIIERGYDLNIWAYARVDTMERPGLLEKMKKAGINWLGLGIEAGSRRVRDDVHKGFGQEKIFRAVKRCEGVGIHVGANYIFGLPDDDTESMKETLDLALELNTPYANFYCAMAYPGSSLYLDALKAGWRLPEKWSGYSQHSEDTLPLPTRHISAGEVLYFRDYAFQVYFTNPAYLEMMEGRFGSETVEHIRFMTRHRLKRKYAMPTELPTYPWIYADEWERGRPQYPT